MSSLKDTLISSISPLTSENYHIWADEMKSWLQLNGLWRLVSGSDKKPAGKPKVLDSKGHVVSPAVPPDGDKLDRWGHTPSLFCAAEDCPSLQCLPLLFVVYCICVCTMLQVSFPYLEIA